MTALIDTSFLLALVFPEDKNHYAAQRAMNNLNKTRIIPMPVLPEVFYMVATRMHYKGAIRAFMIARSNLFQFVELTSVDMSRMQIIMEQYADNEFDFVDTAIMALSERLNVAEIYSFDQRDFRVFRPVHRPYLRILP